MVNTVVLAGGLDAHYVTDALYNANQRLIPFSIGTDGANLAVRYHLAALAIADVVAECVHGVREMMDVLRRLLQEVKASDPPTVINTSLLGS